ncbi:MULTISPECIES: DUF6538 domain-containing protein [unclassified Cupriavidus]|uniref:DUF6538 domain-containing protein n=1 Tax=unclassified Cupriavidus TaxID=2640874 RepID=UPI001C002CA0|nr:MULTISPECIES: DUF6538 domain-containing protein [unclassified Cupriavidus]MCA3184774.1 hypothetical protein [Cupriavidus sp.]MCA3191180.1 hypothetical protein [Cupriavidus sp.]MCA3200244.1 hypothetical protein [Cupriavidus sp.]MCA3205445.1 hypothetical protein [Cupriavidus sp.]MCA3206699.1 hypothetical protein [Cupriavidus sp.]
MHITRRNGVYYFRKKIPVDLVAAYGRREIIYSLRTKDRPMAARLALRAAVQLDDEFSLKRGEPVARQQVAVTSAPAASVSTQGGVETLAPKANKVTLACLIPIWRRENNPTDKTADAVARGVTEVGNPDIRVSPESVIQCGTPFLGMQSRVLQVRMGAVNCLRVYWSRLSCWWSI